MRTKSYFIRPFVACCIAIVAISFVGCSSSQDVPRMAQSAKFTSVENLLVLQPGTSYEKTVETLGSKPYDIHSNQQDGYIIYEYKYKVVERTAPVGTTNTKGGETAGSEVYASKLNTVLLFFKGGKLETFITDKGLANKNSVRLVMLNNTLYAVSSDKAGKYVLEPADLKEPEKGIGNIIKKR